MIILLIGLSFFPLAVFGFSTRTVIMNILEKRIEDSLKQSFDNLSLLINSKLQPLINGVSFHSDDYEIITVIKKWETAPATERALYQLMNQKMKLEFDAGKINYPFHSFITLSDMNYLCSSYTYSPYARYDHILEQIRSEAWFQDLDRSYQKKICIFTREHIFNSMGARQIYVACNIMHEGDVLGITAIGIDERYLAAIINNHCAIDNHSVYILSDKQSLIFEGYYNYLPYDSISRQIKGIDTSVDVERDVLIDGEPFLVVNYKLDINGISNNLNIVALIPKSEIYADIDQLNLIIIVLFSFMSLVMIVIILFIKRTIISPIIVLSRLMSQIEKGDFTVRARVDKSDEIGQLCRQFNYMTDSLNQYIKRIVYEEEQKRKVEFTFLQAQIRPHFIRNTLSIIKWMADIRGADGIGKAITSFCSILEYNFRSSDVLKSIREEFDFLEQYIFLQKIRYQSRFVFQTQIEPEILNLYILKMTLQPIIENCVMNGLSGKKGTMTIKVKGYQDTDRVVFVVEDDGVGICQDKLVKLRAEIDKGELNLSIKKTGLINVFNRLRMYFGEACTFNITSEPGKGTCVRMEFPIIARKEVQDAIEDHAC